MLQRISTEVAQENVFVRTLRDFQPAVVPKAFEIRNSCLVGSYSLAPSIVKMAKPAHFVATFGKGRLAIETTGKVAEDREIVARAVHRLDRLFHGNDKAVGRRTADIVALERGGGWQHDIGMARRCRPPWLVPQCQRSDLGCGRP